MKSKTVDRLMTEMSEEIKQRVDDYVEQLMSNKMTPKEKAEELVEKFMSIGQVKMSDYSVIYLPTAKQCARIAVNEVIRAIDNTNLGVLNFWKEVRDEIDDI